jgi:hypothetical protein
MADDMVDDRAGLDDDSPIVENDRRFAERVNGL